MNEYQVIISKELDKRKSRNTSYSLRAFASSLGISAATLSQIMSGKRPLTMRAALKIADRCALSASARKVLFSSVVRLQGGEGFGDESGLGGYHNLELEQFRIIADWYHFAILSLGQTPFNQYDPTVVSSKLGIPKRLAKQALERLLSLDLIRVADGCFHQCGTPIIVDPKRANSAVKQFHGQIIDLAKQSLVKDDWNTRDITAMIMAVPAEKLQKASDLIRKFREEFCEQIESDASTEVYSLCIQFIPLTKRKIAAHAPSHN